MSSLPPACGAPKILLLSSLVVTIVSALSCLSRSSSKLFPLSQSMDIHLPEAWHRTPFPPIGQLLICQFIASSLNVPTFSTGLFWEPCFPETSKLVPSLCDWKAPFCISWVGLQFQAYFWPGIKDCPSVQEFQAWTSRWMRYFGGQRFCLSSLETTPPSALVQDIPPILEKTRAHFLLSDLVLWDLPAFPGTFLTGTGFGCLPLIYLHKVFTSK